MKDVFDIINTRASTKGYTDKIPSAADIDKIIHAGLRAASGRNLQAPIIVAITNKEVRDRLAKANGAVINSDADPFYGAPAILVVLAKKSVRTRVYDGSLVLGNMMLAAHALGLGSCWIHRARETFELPEWKEWLRAHGIEGEYEGVGNLVLGYRSGDYPAEKPRLPGRVYYI